MRSLEIFARRNWIKSKGTVHFAALSINGKLIGFTQNCAESSRIFGKNTPTRHAEIRVLLLTPNEKQKKISVYVCRLSKETEKLANSKPCQHCVQTLKSFGVARVFYTDDTGKWKNEKIENIKDPYMSLGNRLKNRTV
jgi:cytidine deaminase